jgi:hypothetical protein
VKIEEYLGQQTVELFIKLMNTLTSTLRELSEELEPDKSHKVCHQRLGEMLLAERVYDVDVISMLVADASPGLSSLLMIFLIPQPTLLDRYTKDDREKN